MYLTNRPTDRLDCDLLLKEIGKVRFKEMIIILPSNVQILLIYE